MKPKIVIALNTTWNLFNFRAGLIRALLAEGYDVVAVAPPDDYVSRLVSFGCGHVPLPMDNQGTHPGRDLILLWRFLRLLRAERPFAYLGYTVKPNVYGSIAAHILGIPVINNIAGLGTVFVRGNWLTSLVRCLYRVALSKSRRVFFQNSDDLAAFVGGGLVRADQARRLPGSGVDLSAFVPMLALPRDGRKFRFLLVARMLWDKGVAEYVEAARLLRARHADVECRLLGFLDVKNPDAIPREQMESWVAEGVVKYLGVTDDVRPLLGDSDCVVLPSYYREGVPRTLLEAAAMGLPVVTTDAAGCRDVVEDGVNGYLVRARDAADLADKMERMIALSSEARLEMGRRGRKKMECEFNERIVIDRYLDELRALGESVR
ncbi:MAG: glycosyltransferase family 4 protein [Pseudomonadota bacterium]